MSHLHCRFGAHERRAGTSIKAGVVGTAVVLAGLVAGGCSSGPAARTSAPPSTSTSKSSAVSTTVPATSTVSSTTAPQVTNAAVACQNSDIKVIPLGYGAAAGNVAETIGFVNVGDRSCFLSGYPGVAGQNAQGNQVVQATRELNGMLGGVHDSSSAPPVVALAPGQTASADVEGGDAPVGNAGSCAYYPYFLVTPPNETQSMSISNIGVQQPGTALQGFPGCDPIRIDPVVSGDTGRAS
jgi:hypothetical protein